MSLKAKTVETLESFADLLEFMGENPFRISALRKGANLIKSIEGNIEEKFSSGELNQIKGIGKGIITIIKDIYDNGYSEEYEKCKSQFPHGLFDLFKIKGLGPRKIKSLYDNLKISDLLELEKACSENKIAGLKGFGDKTQTSILNELQRLKNAKKYILIDKATLYCDKIKDSLKSFDGVFDIIETGSLRRGAEIYNMLEFVVLINNEKEFINELRKAFSVFNVEIKVQNKHDVELKTAELEIPFNSRFYFTERQEELARILFITSSSEKFISTILKNEKIELESDESKVFKKLGFNYIAPEMREEEYFLMNERLRTVSDLTPNKVRGLLHFHTNMSDGLSSLKEMTIQAGKLGFQYAAVCDHSKSAYYAGGLDEARVIEQRKTIEEINKDSEVHVFSGIESDILLDGSLDYDYEFLRSFDFIIASVHSAFNLPEAEMTKRMINAVENPFVNALGHPTGRMLLAREAYKIDTKKIIDACAANNVAIEINCNPYRLDLDWRNVIYGREKGCMFAINPDAHSIEGINDIKYGIKIAQKSGLTCSEVINCFSLKEIKEYLSRKR